MPIINPHRTLIRARTSSLNVQTSVGSAGQSSNQLLILRYARRSINTQAICLSIKVGKRTRAAETGFHEDIRAPDHTMASQRPVLLFLCVALALSLQLSKAQHWSHGWYPGGKREVSLPQSQEASEDIKLCDGEDCAYLTIPREKIVKTLLADLLARQLQKKK